MSDFSRLEEKLAKLAEREKSDRQIRRLTGGSGDVLLARFVSEVDEIILPRKLTLTSESGAVLNVIVASRRLQAVLAPLPNAAAAAEALAGQALAAGDEDALETLGGALRSLFEHDANFKVSTSRPDASQTFPAESGVPSGALARSWDVSLDAAGDSDFDGAALLSDFLDQVGAEATAWLRIDAEDVTGQHGSDADVERLSAVLGEILDSYLGKQAVLGVDPSAPALVSYGADQAGVLLADHGAAKAIILVASGQTQAAMARWQNILVTAKR